MCVRKRERENACENAKGIAKCFPFENSEIVEKVQFCKSL